VRDRLSEIACTSIATLKWEALDLAFIVHDSPRRERRCTHPVANRPFTGVRETFLRSRKNACTNCRWSLRDRSRPCRFDAKRTARSRFYL
jgi:hypothetical protein